MWTQLVTNESANNCFAAEKVCDLDPLFSLLNCNYCSK